MFRQSLTYHCVTIPLELTRGGTHFSWEYKIIAIYFFAFGNIYKTLIFFNWKYCHVLVGMLHNVSKLFFFCDLQVTTDCSVSRGLLLGTFIAPTRGSVSTGNSEFLFLLFTVENDDTLKHVSHSANWAWFKRFNFNQKAPLTGCFFSLILKPWLATCNCLALLS